MHGGDAGIYGGWRRLGGRPRRYLSLYCFIPEALYTDDLQEARCVMGRNSEDDCDISPIFLNFWTTTEPQILCLILESQSLSLTRMKFLEDFEMVLVIPSPRSSKSLFSHAFFQLISKSDGQAQTWKRHFIVMLSYESCSRSGCRYTRVFSMPNGQCLKIVYLRCYSERVQ